MVISTSSRKVALLRMVLLFCPALWDGPQPAVVVGGPFVEPSPTEVGGGQAANVNALVDGANHAAALKAFRERSAGNTFTSVPIYDPLSPEQREHLKTVGTDWSDRPFAWAEWPAIEQAPRSDPTATTSIVAEHRKDMEAVAAAFKQQADYSDRLRSAVLLLAQGGDETAARIQELLA